jgi:serine/threonine-protein kinase
MATKQDRLKTGPAPMADADLAATAKVRAQLERILESPLFQAADRRSKLLRYLVEKALADEAGSLKESVIATEVFGRGADYDPQIDSIVRVEIGRLRSRLTEYYGTAGPNEAVRIEIPKGGYKPIFQAKDVPREPVLPPAPAPVPPSRLRGRIAIAAVVILAIGAGVWAWWAASAASEISSIAVLPFLNLSGDPANEYLGDGISEEVTEALSESDGMRVVSRTSAFQFKGKSADIREIGQRLGASAVLEGSVAPRGGGFHVVAQLIRVRDGLHLWSQSYDGNAVELPALEARIADTVREKLGAPSSPKRSAQSAEVPTANSAEAHDLYLRAAFEFNRRTVASTRTAIQLAQEAAARDPSYSQPYVLMAGCESMLTTLLAEKPHAAAERARQYIAKALDIDPKNSVALGQKAMLDYVDGWDWPQAEREFQRTLATGSHGAVENLYGWCLMTRGRFSEARKHLQMAADLDPLSLGPQLNQVEELAYEGNLKGSQAKVDQILKTAPSNPVALAQKATLAVFSGDCAGATASSSKLLQLYPQLAFGEVSALGSDGVCGRRDQAELRLAGILAHNASGKIGNYTIADIFAYRGDADKAIAYLQESADRREPPVLYLKIDHLLDKIRNDPRFTALERRIGL